MATWKSGTKSVLLEHAEAMIAEPSLGVEYRHVSNFKETMSLTEAGSTAEGSCGGRVFAP